MARKGGCPLRENVMEWERKETSEAKEDARMKQHKVLTESSAIGWQSSDQQMRRKEDKLICTFSKLGIRFPDPFL